MLKRRIISLTILFSVTLTLYVLAPILLVLALLLSSAPRYRTLPHALLFALGFLFHECVGVLWLFGVWLRDRNNNAAFMAGNQRVQYWWGGGLLRLGVRIYDIDVVISGEDAVAGRSALLIARHTSIGDTVLPMRYFAERRGEGLRYILKNELAALPCLDIAGHRLPNLFVDRSGEDSQRELAAVRRLTAEAGEAESVLIYPEGTRFTLSRRAALRATKPELTDQLERWPDLLPPRLGGVSAMLEANPGKDVVFLAHTGFEGTASLTDLINGAWRRQVVRLHFWRVRYEDIPSDHRAFIFHHWDEMQEHVTAMVSGENGVGPHSGSDP